MSQENRLVWADGIRLLAIYLVIVIHLASVVVIPWENAFLSFWWGAHILSSVAVVAVPWLVILSGSLLLTKVEPALFFYTKRTQKIVVPWIFWLIVSFVVAVYGWQTVTLDSRSPISLIVEYVRTGYWFIPVLVQLYLVTPFLRRILTMVSRHWGVIAALIWQLLIAIQYTWCITSNACQPWPLPLGLQYIGYFVLGYYATTKHFSIQKSISLAAFIFGVGFSVIVGGTVALSQHQQGFNAALYHFISLPTFLISVSGFYLVKKLFQHIRLKKQAQILLEKLSKESFSIFFIHGFLLQILILSVPTFFKSSLSILAGALIPLWAGLLFYCSYMIIIFLRKMPLLQKVV